MWNTDSFEWRVYACTTCHRRIQVCPDCGQPLGFLNPDRKLFCKADDVEAIEIEEKVKTPGDCMGFDGYYVASIYECPVCSKRCCPSKDRVEERYTGESEDGNTHSHVVVAHDGTRYKNTGFRVEGGPGYQLP